MVLSVKIFIPLKKNSSSMSWKSEQYELEEHEPGMGGGV